jgi:exosortase
LSTRPSEPPAPPVPPEPEAPPPQGNAAAEIPAPVRQGRLLGHPLVRDLVVGVALGGLLAVSAFTPNEWPPSLGLGAAAAMFYVGWRTVQRRRSPVSAAGETPTAPLAPFLRVPASVWVAIVVLAAVFTPAAVWLYRSWTATVWNNPHGILIPPTMGYLVWSILRRDGDSSPQSSAWGFAFLVPGLLLVSIDAVLRTHQLAGLGFVLCLPGLSLLLLGAARTSRLRIPLLLAFLMVPLPRTLANHIYLKQLTAAAAAPLISSLGIPLLHEDVFLHLPHSSFRVLDACSGFGTLYVTVGLSVVLAATSRSHWRKVFILVAGPSLALLCNVVRIALLVAIGHFLGLGLLDTRFHEASGVATFLGVLVLLFLIADRRSLRESFL